MGKGSKLAALALTAFLGIINIAKSGLSELKSVSEFLNVSGRFSIYDTTNGVYYSPQKGDEIRIYKGSNCISSTNVMDSLQSHYYDLFLLPKDYEALINNSPDYRAIAYWSRKKDFYYLDIMGCYQPLSLLDFRGSQRAEIPEPEIPEPGSLSLLTLGALALKKKNRL